MTPPAPRRQRRRRRRRRSEGFALIIVLWTLVLIAFITAHLVGTGRIEVRIATNLAADAVTQAAADGAVSRAIFNLLEPDPQHRWPLDGTARLLTIGDCQVKIRVTDEAGRINPNIASPALLEALLRVTGSDPENARRLAAAIGEWAGSPDANLPADDAIAEYRAAGRDYAPPNEPLQTLDELRNVLGMTPEIFAAIEPHMSLFAPPDPIAEHADPVVAAALATMGEKQTGAPPAEEDPANATVRIQVDARGPGNARAGRIAVVQMAPGAGAPVILAWNSNTANEE